MKATTLALTGSDQGSWLALCADHASRYQDSYPKRLTVSDSFWYEGKPSDCSVCKLAADLERRHRGGYIDVNDLADINKRAGCHFFDADTMRGFSSTIPDAGRFLPGDWLSIVFISSEKRRGFACADGPRTYTVRVMDCVTGYIREDPAGFEGYPDLRRARKAMDRVLTAGRVQVAA